jgi:hypothetical protein
LGRDIREYNRDRDALRRAYRRGASPGRIDHLRDELRDGRREIFQGRRELRNDYAELRRDHGRYGHGRYDNRGRGWWQSDNNWNRRFDRPDRDFWRD